MKKSYLSLLVVGTLVGALTAHAAVNAPSNLTINSQYTSGGIISANLGWTDNSTNELGFQLFRSNTSTGSAVIVQQVGVNVTSTSVNLIESGSGSCQNNYYTVRAYRKKNPSTYEYSSFSNQVNVTNPSGNTCN